MTYLSCSFDICQAPFIGQSARFICNSLIPVVKKNYLRSTGVVLHGIDQLQTPLKDVQSKTVASK